MTDTPHDAMHGDCPDRAAESAPHHDHGSWLQRIFHSHSHGDDQVADHLQANKDGIRALVISLVALSITAFLQLIIVFVSGSVALLADTIHNFSDALTAIPLGLAFTLGRRAANERYTYGYGRAEDLAGIAVLLTIAASSAVAAYEAANRLIHPRPIHNVGWVIAAGVIGFIGNELVAVYRIRVGRRIGSAALVADGLHARTDGLTSLAVVAGALGIVAGWRQADPLAGLLISLAICAVLAQAARGVYYRLMDAVDPALTEQARTVVSTTPHVEDVRSVRLRWVGHELRADVELSVPAVLTMTEADAVSHHAERHLRAALPRLSTALIHVHPA